ncbi:hypothetical protein SKAU_G00401390 [Synaphobranchus kaupii]|uniref:Uncharacterized protein n=1 Tax=Synaphobranchus kaupii TaxID=118154 RepID=A0A9Q1IBL1_SYNKA|nr:hypothetical protein SKAU_G00401390 [Synaphobranchus kaupii]
MLNLLSAALTRRLGEVTSIIALEKRWQMEKPGFYTVDILNEALAHGEDLEVILNDQHSDGTPRAIWRSIEVEEGGLLPGWRQGMDVGYQECGKMGPPARGGCSRRATESTRREMGPGWPKRGTSSLWAEAPWRLNAITKCQLFRRRTCFLGHIVESDGVATDPAKIETVRAGPTPSSRMKVRSFLGLACDYRELG